MPGDGMKSIPRFFIQENNRRPRDSQSVKALKPDRKKIFRCNRRDLWLCPGPGRESSGAFCAAGKSCQAEEWNLDALIGLPAKSDLGGDACLNRSTANDAILHS